MNETTCNEEVSGRQRNVQKKCAEKMCCKCKVAFLPFRPIVVFFYRSPALPSPLRLALHDFTNLKYCRELRF